MSELIDVHFMESSFANRESKKNAIMLDINQLYPAGIFRNKMKKIESNMRSEIIERVILEMGGKFEKQGFHVPGFGKDPVGNRKIGEKDFKDNLSKIRKYLPRRICTAAINKQAKVLSFCCFSVGTSDIQGTGHKH